MRCVILPEQLGGLRDQRKDWCALSMSCYSVLQGVLQKARPMTISVRLDEATAARLRCMLDEQGGSLSAFVRAAILEKLEREGKKPTPYELGKHLFGRFKSGKGDLAENHSKYIKEAMRAKHRR